MQFFAYILECADKTLYSGCTNNLEKRLREHNNCKRGAHYTKIRRPVELRYFEAFESLKEARAREAQIKRCCKEEKLNLIANKKTGIIKTINANNMTTWTNKRRLGRKVKKGNRTKLNKRKK